MASASLERTYTYHPPFGTQQERYVALREAGKALASAIIAMAPPSREASVALTNVQQAIMWSNAAIAINEVAPPVPTAEYEDSKFNVAPAEPVAVNQESV